MTSRLSLSIAALALAGVLAGARPAAAAGFVLEGRALDAEASVAAYRTRSPGGDWKVPLANLAIDVLVLPMGKSFGARTDASGAFSLDTGLSARPSDARFVVSAKVSGHEVYSATMPLVDEAADIFLYATIEGEPDEVQGELSIVHELVRTGEDEDPRVRVRVRFFAVNATPYLWTGAKQGSRHRAILRVPLPSGAEIDVNAGPFPGARWNVPEGGTWAVIDDPAPGLADLLDKTEAQGLEVGARWWTWDLAYTVPARQTTAYTYPIPLGRFNVRTYADASGMEIISPQLGEGRPVNSDPLEPSGSMKALKEYGGGMRESETLVYAVSIDNAAIGQISSRALRWHGGFLLVALIAIVLGLAFSPRKPPEEAMVQGLSSEEILDRIAALDRRHEAGRLPRKEWEKYRERLVQIAAEELDADAASPAPSAAPAASDSAGRGGELPKDAADLLARIQEIDASGDLTAETVQQRAHLLESLYKTLHTAKEGRTA